MSVITIGNFDGVHTGHQQLLRQVVNLAREDNCKSKVITFDPHPVEVLTGDPLRLVYDIETKVKALKSCGIEEVQLVHFDTIVARTSAQDFLTDIVQVTTGDILVQGSDFKFGYQASCDIDCLKILAEKLGFRFQEFILPDKKTSSSTIRKLLAQNDFATALQQFGGKYIYNYDSVIRPLKKPVEVVGKVVQGSQYGRRIETPTANLDTALAGLADGIYAGFTTLENGEVWPSGISVVDGQIESHLIGFTGDLYDQNITVCFTHMLRPYYTFDTEHQLITQIKRDLLQSLKLYEQNSTET